MRAVIPVAGLGTRLRPLTFSMPKALVQVAGKPVLSHILQCLDGVEPEEVVIVASPWGSKEVEELAKLSSPYPVKTVIQEDPKGLGDAILQTRSLFKSNEAILILLGDTILDMDLKKLLGESSDFLGVLEVEDPRRFGIAILDDEGFIVEVEEKPDSPRSNLALVGLYLISDSGWLFESLTYIKEMGIRTKGEIQLTDALQHMIKEGWKARALFVEGWHDCGKLETLLESNRELLKKRGGRSARCKDCEIVEPVYIGEDVKIENSKIGPFVSIGPGSTIRDSSVEDSIIHDGTTIESSRLFQSIIGKGAWVRDFQGTLILGDLSRVEGGSPTP